jgi:threonine/homoserine/homoserine lactone efflux protein
MDTDTLIFILKSVAVSLTGVLAPGAMTAATIAHGTRTRWAGLQIALGHGFVEIPLIGLLLVGLHIIFQMPSVQIVIGLLGGAFILWMGWGMLRQTPPEVAAPVPASTRSTFLTGIVLSAANPYFLLWWATVGLNLALDAKQLGLAALVLFAVIHWTCDLVWLTILSFGAFYTQKTAGLFGRKIQQWILIICGLALLFFGGKFIFGAFTELLN